MNTLSFLSFGTTFGKAPGYLQVSKAELLLATWFELGAKGVDVLEPTTRLRLENLRVKPFHDLQMTGVPDVEPKPEPQAHHKTF